MYFFMWNFIRSAGLLWNVSENIDLALSIMLFLFEDLYDSISDEFSLNKHRFTWSNVYSLFVILILSFVLFILVKLSIELFNKSVSLMFLGALFPRAYFKNFIVFFVSTYCLSITSASIFLFLYINILESVYLWISCSSLSL